MKNIRIKIPHHCHLWKDKYPNRKSLVTSLELINTFEEDSHLTRKLMKCKDCGQLYFYEFYEIVDWKNGKDAQYYKWIPVKNEKVAEELSKLIPHELLRLPAIRIDFPTDADKPEGPYFISE